MAEENQQKQEQTAKNALLQNVKPAGETPAVQIGRKQKTQGQNRNFGERRQSRKGSREERVRPEFDQKILIIRRVARVAAGGRRFNFSVAMVLGNRKGSVGVGTGKGADTSLAIDKATRNAKKRMIKIFLTKTSSIPYPVNAKYSSARVFLMPAPGRGLIAGSAVRDVLELGGVHNVAGKIFSGSKNKLNIAQAAIKALKEFTAPTKEKDKEPNPKLSAAAGDNQNLKPQTV